MIYAAIVGYRSSLHTVYGYKLDSYNNNILCQYSYANSSYVSIPSLDCTSAISLGSKVSLHKAHLQRISFAGINIIPQYTFIIYIWEGFM